MSTRRSARLSSKRKAKGEEEEWDERDEEYEYDHHQKGKEEGDDAEGEDQNEAETLRKEAEEWNKRPIYYNTTKAITSGDDARYLDQNLTYLAQTTFTEWEGRRGVNGTAAARWLFDLIDNVVSQWGMGGKCVENARKVIEGFKQEARQMLLFSHPNQWFVDPWGLVPGEIDGQPGWSYRRFLEIPPKAQRKAECLFCGLQRTCHYSTSVMTINSLGESEVDHTQPIGLVGSLCFDRLMPIREAIFLLARLAFVFTSKNVSSPREWENSLRESIEELRHLHQKIAETQILAATNGRGEEFDEEELGDQEIICLEEIEERENDRPMPKVPKGTKKRRVELDAGQQLEMEKEKVPVVPVVPLPAPLLPVAPAAPPSDFEAAMFALPALQATLKGGKNTVHFAGHLSLADVQRAVAANMAPDGTVDTVSLIAYIRGLLSAQ